MSRKLHFKPRICQECGKEFIPKCGTQRYCDGPHNTHCKICGKEISYTCSPKEKPSYCSQECIDRGRKQTVMKKYGVNNVSELQHVRDKISERNSSEEVKHRRAATCIEKYGVDNVSKADEVRKKLSEIMKTEKYLKGREQTCIEKYGTTSPMQNKEVLQRRTATYLDKYGTIGRPVSRSYYEHHNVDGTKVDAYLAFKTDPQKFLLSNYDQPPTTRQLQHDLGVTETPIYNIIIQHSCKELVAYSYSYMEEDIYQFLCTIVDSSEIIRNDRTMIKPLELDFYLPKYCFAIECNPSSTHNSSKSFFCDRPTNYRYHQMKSNTTAEKGIFLFHIFGYEWNARRIVIESMIKNVLHKNRHKLGARQTYVDNISALDCKKFLDINHLQGSTISRIRLGLRSKDSNELLSVMTFGKLRPTLGQSNRCSTSDWELSRFCTRLDTTVVGGAQKLFKYFVSMYHPTKIISFSDVAHTRGDLYRILGFNNVHMTSPSYVWSDICDRFYYNRVSCQKQNLKKLLNDDSIDLSQTEKTIMESHGFVKVYDSGVIKWVWKIEDEEDL